MDAYEDGYRSPHSDPPSSLSRPDWEEYKRGQEAKAKILRELTEDSTKQVSPEAAGAGVIAIFLLIAIGALIAGCVILLDWVKHTVRVVPSGVWVLVGASCCAAIIYWIAREIKRMK